MWLINIETRSLEQFQGPATKPYAILSHTWEDEEISFQEMQNPTDDVIGKKGYKKIEETCLQAGRDGLDYAWVDTCCIDKSSSAELTESINSMFHWYQGAARCYVYLCDLDSVPSTKNRKDLIQDCRWLTRGWTLQELFAPKNVDFFNKDWEFCFTKSEAAFALYEITGIDLEILERRKDLSAVSVAQKMSWAARRKTTRIEDRAYCLLGIFDINMPLLYGERDKAFMRLQTEIIRSTPDLSILAWLDPRPGVMEGRPDDLFSGVLAYSPDHFDGCGKMFPLETQIMPDFSMSNRGIKLRAKYPLISLSGQEGRQFVLPVCRSFQDVLCIKLRSVGTGCFVRQDPYALESVGQREMSDGLVLDPYLLTRLPSQLGAPRESLGLRGRDYLLSSRYYGLRFNLPSMMAIYRRWPWPQWDEVDMLFTGLEDLRMGWAAVKIVARSPGSLGKHMGSREVTFMFYAIGWAKRSDDPPHCTIFPVSGQMHHRMLEDMNDRGVAEGWAAYWMVNRLALAEVAESPAFVVHSSKGSTLLLCWRLKQVEDRNICANKFWTVTFEWEVIPTKGLRTRVVDHGWTGSPIWTS